MTGTIIFPPDANGNQQSFLLSQISNVWAVNAGISGISSNSVAFNITGNGAAYGFAFTFLNANCQTIANLINSLIASQSNAVTNILDVAPPTASLGVVSGSGPWIITVTGTSLGNAAFLSFADGTQLSVNIPGSTPTSVVTFPSNYNPSPVPTTTVLDASLNIIAVS